MFLAASICSGYAFLSNMASYDSIEPPAVYVSAGSTNFQPSASSNASTNYLVSTLRDADKTELSISKVNAVVCSQVQSVEGQSFCDLLVQEFGG